MSTLNHKLCLNMIVKNESHIIQDTLSKLLNKVQFDYWVISDTGSTDNTQQIIIDFFKEKNIQGELFQDAWQDFGYNRTKALEHAFGKSEYVIIFDADDEIYGNFILPSLTSDSYQFQFGHANGTSYLRTQIVNNRKRWKYVGVLHEYIECVDSVNGSEIISGDYYIISGRTSSRNKDKNKYLNDALILEKAYSDAFQNNDNIYNRYAFYCANSYRDCGRREDAIKWYKKTIDGKNWNQEKYVSCLNLYRSYNALNQKELGMFYLVKAFSYDNQRAECVYELVSYYCANNMNEIAYGYYSIVKSFYENTFLTANLINKLFLEPSKSNFFLPYYMIIVADRVKDIQTGILMYRIIFTKKHIETNKFFIGNTLFNLQFFIEAVKDDIPFLNLFRDYIDFLLSINYPVYEHECMIHYNKYIISTLPNKQLVIKPTKTTHISHEKYGIFICIFNQEQYVNMFYLLLESLFTYGNLDDNIDILVYTSTQFMNKIMQSHLFNTKIVFEINDTYSNIDKACKSRLDIFELPSTTKYAKILYLDTDILVKDDINILFDVCEKDILYVLEEGDLGQETHDYHGKSLFGDELNNYDDKTAFTSGILLFNNCEKIKDLFEKIKEDIVKRPHPLYDQPHIVYNAFKYNLFNNKVLKSLVVNNDFNINSDKVIHHFPGGPGIYGHKINKMTAYLNSIKDYTIINNINKAKLYINEYLMPIIHNSGELLEGNIFMLHQTTKYTDTFLNKSKNISNLVLNTNIKNVMEIGFNSGFSTLLMLLSNPNMKIMCVDLGEHKYTMPCYTKLKETFGDRINLLIGDSTKTLQTIDDVYDLIHIDGGHSTEVADSDIVNSYRLSKPGTIIIMDDYDFSNLHKLWDIYIKKYDLKPLNINTYSSPHHDIKYV